MPRPCRTATANPTAPTKYWPVLTSVALDLSFVGDDPWHGDRSFPTSEYWDGIGGDSGPIDAAPGQDHGPAYAFVGYQWSGLDGGGYIVPYAAEFVVPAGTVGYLGPLDFTVSETSWYKYPFTEWNYFHGGGGYGMGTLTPNMGDPTGPFEYALFDPGTSGDPFDVYGSWAYPQFWLDVEINGVKTMVTEAVNDPGYPVLVAQPPWIGSTYQPHYPAVASATVSAVWNWNNQTRVDWNPYHGGAVLDPGHYFIGAGVGAGAYSSYGHIGVEFYSSWLQYFSPWTCTITGRSRPPSWADLGQPATDALICGPPGTNCPI